MGTNSSPLSDFDAPPKAAQASSPLSDFDQPAPKNSGKQNGFIPSTPDHSNDFPRKGDLVQVLDDDGQVSHHQVTGLDDGLVLSRNPYTPTGKEKIHNEGEPLQAGDYKFEEKPGFWSTLYHRAVDSVIPPANAIPPLKPGEQAGPPSYSSDMIPGVPTYKAFAARKGQEIANRTGMQQVTSEQAQAHAEDERPAAHADPAGVIRQRSAAAGSAIGKDFALQAVTSPVPQPGIPQNLPMDSASIDRRKQEFERDSPVAAGIIGGGGSFVGGLLGDPSTYTLMAMGPTSKFGKALVSGGFGYQMGKGTIQSAGQMGELWDRSDVPRAQKVEMATQTILGLVMAGMAGGHGAQETRGLVSDYMARIPEVERAQVQALIDQRIKVATTQAGGATIPQVRTAPIDPRVAGAADLVSKSNPTLRAPVSPQAAKDVDFFLNGPKPQPAAAPPPTAPPLTEAEAALVRHGQSRGDIPTAQPAPAPPPPGPAHITPASLDGISQAIAAAPPDAQPAMKLKAYQNLVGWIMSRPGRSFADPVTGEIHTAKDVDEAAKIAREVIKRANEDHDKAQVAAQSAKAEQIAAQPPAPVPQHPALHPNNIEDLAQHIASLDPVHHPDAISEAHRQLVDAIGQSGGSYVTTDAKGFPKRYTVKPEGYGEAANQIINDAIDRHAAREAEQQKAVDAQAKAAAKPAPKPEPVGATSSLATANEGQNHEVAPLGSSAPISTANPAPIEEAKAQPRANQNGTVAPISTPKPAPSPAVSAIGRQVRQQMAVEGTRPGERLFTKSGRQTDRVPNRAGYDAWLIKEAQKEQPNIGWLAKTSPRDLTDQGRAALNHVVFGNADGPNASSRVAPATAALETKAVAPETGTPSGETHPQAVEPLASSPVSAPQTADVVHQGPRPADQTSAAISETKQRARDAGKPPYEMSREELDTAVTESQGREHQDLVDLFGEEGAKKFRRLERTANGTSERRDASAEELGQMEDSLTKEQQNILYGIGDTRPTYENLKDFQDAIGALDWESPAHLGDSLRWSLTKIGDPDRLPSEMKHEEQVAFSQLRHAFDGAKEKGWDTDAIMRRAISAAAKRFEDPNDAAFMLQKVADNFLRTQAGREPEAKQLSTPADRRTAPRETPDRRQDIDTRKRVEEMSPDERAHALLTADYTGLPNRRAFNEDAKTLAESHPHIGYADIDDFKNMNTALGHTGVNEAVFPAVADVFKRAISKEPGGSIKIYHVHGDEFLFRSNDPARVKRVVERVNSELANTTFKYETPDGKILEKKGAGLSHGTGTDAHSAEISADADKQSRKAAGLRTGERDVPAVAASGSGGEQTGVGDAAERAGVSGKEVKPVHEFASTQINIDPQSDLGKFHAAAVAAIPEDHIGKEGREKTPHVTVRYGLKDDSPAGIEKIKAAVAKIPAFEVPVGKTDIFPASEHSSGDHPVVAKLEKTPELLKLRDAVEGAGGFKEDNFPTYEPHITLAYVKPEFAEQYKGGAQLEGQKVPIKEIAVSKRDGTTEMLPLGKPAESKPANPFTIKAERARAEAGSAKSNGDRMRALADKKAYEKMAEQFDRGEIDERGKTTAPPPPQTGIPHALNDGDSITHADGRSGKVMGVYVAGAKSVRVKFDGAKEPEAVPARFIAPKAEAVPAPEKTARQKMVENYQVRQTAKVAPKPEAPAAPGPGSPEYEALRQRIAAAETRKPVETPGRALVVRRGQKTAERLRTVADAMEKQIEDKRRPMTQNMTPKRSREYQSRMHDANNQERVQQAMRALADAHENGTIPRELADLRSKDDIYRLVYKGVTGEGGYYSVIPSREYGNKSPQAKMMQDLMENSGKETSAEKAEKERQNKISQEEAAVQLSNIPGYFPTPKPVVERMLAAADIRPGMSVLEPSAGKGNIADAIKAAEPEADLSTIERHNKLRGILDLKGHKIAGEDFTEHEGQYDRIVMNPPFENGQDMDHVQRAFDMLKPGGKVVAIMSEGPFFRSDKKATAFRDWLDENGGTSEKLDAGSFKSSERPTGVNTRIVEIDKPGESAVAQPAAAAPAPAREPVSTAKQEEEPVATINGKTLESTAEPESIKQFDQAMEHTGAEVKTGQPSPEFAKKIAAATTLEPADNTALQSQFKGAAYQREYFKAALETAKQAYLNKNQAASGHEGDVWEFLSKHSGDKPKPDGINTGQLYIKVPDDGHFLINNNPKAIESALKGADRGFTPPKPINLTPRKSSNPRSPAEFDNEKYITGLEKELADLRDKRRAAARMTPDEENLPANIAHANHLDEQIKAAEENLAEARQLPSGQAPTPEPDSPSLAEAQQPEDTQGTIRADYRPPTANDPPTITLSPAAAKLISAAKGYPKIDGVHASAEIAGSIGDRLAAKAKEYGPDSGSLQKDTQALAEAFHQAARSAGKGGIIALREGVSKAIRDEERFHSGQGEIGEGTTAQHLETERANRLMERHPVVDHFENKFATSAAYKDLYPIGKVAEIAAKIASGQHGPLSAKDRADWFNKYVDELEAQHGPEKVAEVFAKMYDSAKELYATAKDTNARAAAGTLSGRSGPGEAGIRPAAEGAELGKEQGLAQPGREDGTGETGRGEAQEAPVGPQFSAAEARKQTDTPEFKKWFGDSKVVDEQGRPLAVYHGTRGDFSVFDKGNLGASSQHRSASLGFFFTSDPEVASMFHGDDVDWTDKGIKLTPRQGSNIMPVHLKVENPYEMPLTQFREEMIHNPKAVGAFRRSLIEQGYDGIHVPGNPALKESMGGAELAGDTWVAFEPEQVKSATGNRGTFDPKNPDINFSSDEPKEKGRGLTKSLGPKIPPGREGEAGFARANLPVAVAHGIGKAAGAVRDFLTEQKPETKIARGVDDNLFELGKQQEADALRMLQLMKKAAPETTPEDQAQIFRSYEPRTNVTLTPGQEAFRDEVVQPVKDQAAQIRAELNGMGIPSGEPDFIHREVKGKPGVLDRAAAGKPGSGKGNILSTSASSLKKREMYALLDPAGKATVIKQADGRITAFTDKKSTDLGTSSNIATAKDRMDRMSRSAQEDIKAAQDRIGEIPEEDRKAQLDNLNSQIRNLERQQGLLGTVKGRVIGGESVHGVEPTFTQRKNITTELGKLKDRRDAIAAIKGPFNVTTAADPALGFMSSRAQAEFKRETDSLRAAQLRLAAAKDAYGKYDPNAEIFRDKNGREWEKVEANSDEIQNHTNLEYHQNALATVVSDYLQLRRAQRAAHALEELKNSPEFWTGDSPTFFKSENGKPAPDGYKRIDGNLPMFRDIWAEPRTAEALNRFARELHQDPQNAIDKIGHFMTSTLMLNPIRHIYNIGNHWLVERGAVAGTWHALSSTADYRAGIRAIRAVTSQNSDFLEALDQGAPMMSHRADLRQLNETLYSTMLGHLEARPEMAGQIAQFIGWDKADAADTGIGNLASRALGIRFLNNMRKAGNRAMWMSNDIFILQSTYAKMERGAIRQKDGSLVYPPGAPTFKEALAETIKHIPDYRIPPRVMDSLMLSKAMSSPLATVFSRYHYGKWKSYGHMLNEVARKDSTPKQRLKGLDHMAAIALITFGLYVAADQIIKKATGDKDARIVRSGASDVPYGISEVVKGHKPPTELIQGTFTPAMLPYAAGQALFNRDIYSGSRVYDPHDTNAHIAQDVGHYLGSTLGPVQQAEQANRQDNPTRNFLFNQVGVTFPKGESQSDALRLVHEYMRENRTMSPDMKRHLDEARAAFPEGTPGKNASDQRKAAIGELKYYLDYDANPLHRVIELEQMRRIYKAASPEEKRIVGPYLLRKVAGDMRSRGSTPGEKERDQKVMDETREELSRP